MTRIALVSSEPLRARVAGIGVRYLELARRLPREGIEIVAVSPAAPEETPLAPGATRRFQAGRLPELLADCDGAVAQGQLANDVLLECPELPVAVDLYDPWLVENLHYTPELGLDPYRNDHATWVLQLSRGDFFLCSSEEQRLFYLGFLAAVGRLNPERVARDPDLQDLIVPVPFGVPEELPPHRPYLEAPPAPSAPGEPPPGPAAGPGSAPAGERPRRILFGALYDWYDPWTLLDALELLERPDPPGGPGETASGTEAASPSGGGAGGARGGPPPWELLLIRHPDPEGTPQRLMAEVERRCRLRGWWGSRVRAVDWVPFERRYDLLRDVDLLVAPHRPTLETRLSLRTRFLDALAVGCPVVTTEGGTLSRLLAEHDAGRVVPPGNARALAAALAELLTDPSAGAAQRVGAARLARRFSWERVLEPLVAFCRSPRRDPTKETFAFRPPTVAPPDGLAFRLRRALRRRVPGLRKPGGGALRSAGAPRRGASEGATGGEP